MSLRRCCYLRSSLQMSWGWRLTTLVPWIMSKRPCGNWWCFPCNGLSSSWKASWPRYIFWNKADIIILNLDFFLPEREELPICHPSGIYILDFLQMCRVWFLHRQNPGELEFSYTCFTACSPAGVCCCLDLQALARLCLPRQLQQKQGLTSSTFPCPRLLLRLSILHIC